MTACRGAPSNARIEHEIAFRAFDHSHGLSRCHRKVKTEDVYYEAGGRMAMQLPDFPRWLRGLFGVFLILFFFNALYALAFFTAIWTWRIDPG